VETRPTYHALIDSLSPAAYLVATRGADLSIPAGKAFAYLLGANGLYKYTVARHFTVTIPIVSWERPLPGLGLIPAGFELRAGRIPGSLLDACLAHAQRTGTQEVLYQFYIHGNRVSVTRPEQIGDRGSIQYQTMEIDPADIVLDLHSHHRMSAAFSAIDDRDEVGLRLYGVIGNIFQRPEISLRIGFYGDFMRLPIWSAFAGPIRLVDRFQSERKQ